MENNMNGASNASQNQTQKTNNTTSQQNASSSGSTQSRATTTPGSSGQQSTSGKGGLSGITDKLQQMGITDKLQQLGNTASEKVSHLSTTQKVVGGSLLALGAGWIAMNSMNKKGGSLGKSGSRTTSDKNKSRKSYDARVK